MSRHRTLHVLVPVFALLLGACASFEEPEVVADCTVEEDGRPDRVVGSAALLLGPGEPATDSVKVTGTANHLDGLAIRQVLVANVVARQQDAGFNYDRWTAEIPFDVLQAIAREEGGSEIDVRVTAHDACDASYLIETLTIPVAEEEPIVVETIDLAVQLPPDRNYLPATLSVPAVARVTANDQALGATVDLTASSGRFGDTNADATSLTLGQLPDGTVGATTLFYGGDPDDVLITARAADRVDTATVQVVGLPTLAPSSVDLAPGGSIGVEVFTGGAVASCTANPTTAFTVASAGTSLVGGGVPVDTNANGSVDFEIAADANVMESASVVVACRDVYGQSSSVTANVNP